jgi:hypothetical protein
MEDSKKGKYKPPRTPTFTSALILASCFGYLFFRKIHDEEIKNT